MLYRVLLVCGVFIAARAFAADETRVVGVNEQEMARALAGKKTFDYLVHLGGIMSAPDGKMLSVEELPAYLKKMKPDKEAAFVFWVQDPAALPTARAAIDRLQQYGATVFAVRVNKKIAPVENPKPGDEKKKSLVLVGKPNPKAIGAADNPPDVSHRPEALRPGALRGPIRYKFSSDDEMIRGVDVVTKAFLSSGPVDPAWCAKSLIINPGAWGRLAHIPELAAEKPMHASIPGKGKTVVLDGRFVEGPEKLKLALGSLRKLIADNGGGTIHALTTAEMVGWWPFIGFDIEEPTYVIETKRHAHRFVVSLIHDQILIVDDLNGLPAL
jgi:hypothetical protein